MEIRRNIVIRAQATAINHPVQLTTMVRKREATIADVVEKWSEKREEVVSKTKRISGRWVSSSIRNLFKSSKYIKIYVLWCMFTFLFHKKSPFQSLLAWFRTQYELCSSWQRGERQICERSAFPCWHKRPPLPPPPLCRKIHLVQGRAPWEGCGGGRQSAAQGLRRCHRTAAHLSIIIVGVFA